MQIWQEKSQCGQRPVDKDQTKGIQVQYHRWAEAAGGREKRWSFPLTPAASISPGDKEGREGRGTLDWELIEKVL